MMDIVMQVITALLLVYFIGAGIFQTAKWVLRWFGMIETAYWVEVEDPPNDRVKF